MCETHTHTHTHRQKDARKDANIDSENRRRLKKWLTNFIRTQNGKYPKQIKAVEIVPKIATRLEQAPGGQNKRHVQYQWRILQRPDLVERCTMRHCTFRLDLTSGSGFDPGTWQNYDLISFRFFFVVFFFFILIIIRHHLGLDRPVSASSKILCKGLLSSSISSTIQHYFWHPLFVHSCYTSKTI